MISEQTLARFQELLTENEVEFTEETLSQDRHLIENLLRQRLFAKLLDDEAGKRASLDIDRQLLRALELLPKARDLFENVVAKKQADSIQ